MTADQEFDPQPADETDPYTDTEYVRWMAREEGETDQQRGISIRDGYRKLVERGADRDEIRAYLHGFSRGALFAIARDSGIAEHCEVA
jgi:hypothetical protein